MKHELICCMHLYIEGSRAVCVCVYESVFFAISFLLLLYISHSVLFFLLFILCNYNLFWCLSKNPSSAHALGIFQVIVVRYFFSFFLCFSVSFLSLSNSLIHSVCVYTFIYLMPHGNHTKCTYRSL